MNGGDIYETRFASRVHVSEEGKWFPGGSKLRADSIAGNSDFPGRGVIVQTGIQNRE